MTLSRTSAKNWLRLYGYILFPLLAFAIPLVVRAIPEILMGKYLVGFDTIGYYVPGTLEWLKTGIDIWPLIADAPLIYIFTIGVTSVGGSIVILIKILGPLLLGILGFVVYFYAHKTLNWSSRKSFLVVLFSTLYFVALRISWDMLRSELGLIFLFLALILLPKQGSVKNGILFSFALIFAVLSHQLVAVIMFAILVATTIQLFFSKKKLDVYKIILCAAPAVFLFLFILYFNYFVYSLSVTGFSVRFSAGFNAIADASYAGLVGDTLGFLAFCYLPLLPFLVFGLRRSKSNIQLKAWMLWVFIPILLVMISPTALFLGGVLPYRWILLLTYPLSFYAVEGFSSIKWNWYKSVYKIAAVIILVLLSASFLVLPNSGAFDYYSNYPKYVPKSMLQNTVQLSDCPDVSNALIWARSSMPTNASLLTHEAFYGWATLTFDSNRLIYYGYDDPSEIAEIYSNSSNPLYLIWWVNGTGWYGQPTVSDAFQQVYHSENIAIYLYSNST